MNGACDEGSHFKGRGGRQRGAARRRKKTETVLQCWPTIRACRRPTKPKSSVCPEKPQGVCPKHSVTVSAYCHYFCFCHFTATAGMSLALASLSFFASCFLTSSSCSAKKLMCVRGCGFATAVPSFSSLSLGRSAARQGIDGLDWSAGTQVGRGGAVSTRCTAASTHTHTHPSPATAAYAFAKRDLKPRSTGRRLRARWGLVGVRSHSRTGGGQSEPVVNGTIRSVHSSP